MPRFYPPGQHPAMAGAYEQLHALSEYRSRVVDTPELLAMIEYYAERVAAFEETEAGLKQLAYEDARRSDSV